MDKITRAWKHFREGRLSEAQRIARELVETHPAAWHLLALVELQHNRLDETERLLRNALDARPDWPEVLGVLGMVLALQKRFNEAVAVLQRSLALSPGVAVTHSNLAMTLLRLGRNAEAMVHLRESLKLRPDFLASLLPLGQLLLRYGKNAEAETTFRSVLEIDPGSGHAHLGLGLALEAQNRHAEAVVAVEHAANALPEHPLPPLILGGLLRDLGHPQEALAACDRAVLLHPDDAEPHYRRGNALDDLCRYPEAIAAYRQALGFDGHHFDALNNLGASLGKQGHTEEALACCDHLLKREPDHYSPHMNRALIRLARGDYANGFAEFEWRWKIPGNAPRPRPRPPWQGEPLEGRTILLHAEQGFGDTIQFIRYAPLLKAAGARVLVECPQPLHRLFTSCPGIDALSVRGETSGDYDVHAPILSLPRLFGTTLETIPTYNSNLAADPASIRRWRERLGQKPGLKIGIVWQGDPSHQRDRVRSFPLAQFEPLASLEGVRLVRLQKGLGSEQLQEPKNHFPIEDPECIAPEDWVDFHDTAAIMANLDLVITPDTAPAHLAGALGIPVWVVLPYFAEWRWLIGREDSPWYPSARLFRQSRPGDWKGLFEQAADELQTALKTIV